MELYFVEWDGSSTDEYFNPRNEIVSLNAALLVVNDALKNASVLKTGMLHGIRNSLTNKINKFSEKTRQESVLSDHGDCGNEKALLQWSEKNGAVIKLQIASMFSSYLILPS